MDGVVYSIFFFIIVPLIYAAFFVDKKSRDTFVCLIVGMVICLISSELNSLMLELSNDDFFYLSTTISPIIEETLKGLPIVFLVFVWYDNTKSLTEKAATCGIAIGVGFALFENIVSFFQNQGTSSIAWSLARGFGSGLVHSICTGIVGIGIALIRKEKRTYLFSMIGLFSATIIYHSLYNCFVQTEGFQLLGIIIPSVTYAIFYVLYRHNKRVHLHIKTLLKIQ